MILNGTQRWLIRFFKYINRLYKIAVKFKEDKIDIIDEKSAKILEFAVHKAIRDVTHAIESWQLNKMISSIREFSNIIEDLMDKTDCELAIKTLFVLVSPVAPHLSEECWSLLGYKDLIINQPWPTFNQEKLEIDLLNIAIQVNGKLRGTISVNKNTTEEEQKALALSVKNIKQHIGDLVIKKTIVIKGKVINFIV